MPVISFPDDFLFVCQRNGDKNFIVYKAVCCRWDGYDVAVPVGFETDLASTPRPFRKSGKWNRAAILHDFLYRGGEVKRGLDGRTLSLDRSQADRMFLDAMSYLNVGYRRYAMYAAVRLFGGWSWAGGEIRNANQSL